MSCRSTILADMDITDRANTWMLIEEIHRFFYEEIRFGLFLVVTDSSWQDNIKNLDNFFFFDFLATLFAKIAQSHLHYLITSFVLKTSVRPFYFIFGLWIFCKSCLGLQQLPNGMQHEHI